jgi:hypothetical protein
MTHAAGIKKAPDDVTGALLRLEKLGLPHPVAELAATAEGYREDPFPATSTTSFSTTRDDKICPLFRPLFPALIFKLI